MALPVVRGRRGGYMNPNRGVRASGPAVIPHRGRDLRETWNTENRSSLSTATRLQSYPELVCVITSEMTYC